MSLITFMKDAGEKLFGNKPEKERSGTKTGSPSAGDVGELNAKAGESIERYIATQNLKARNLDVKFDGATSSVTVSGEAADQDTREKIVLCCGNVRGVATVRDNLTVAGGEVDKSTFHTVKSGDTLSKIAKDQYGDANAYQRIFEANRPMLTHPDKIYPGQVLRIPRAEKKVA